MSNLRLAGIVRLTLTADHLQALRSHAEQAYPHECCGIMLGTVESPNHKKLVAVWAVENTWSEDTAEELHDDLPRSTTHRYAIAPETMLKAMREAKSQALEVIGVYHSHPDHPALPSECDRRLAWPQYSYVILSVIQGMTQDMQSWQLNSSEQFQSEAIEIQPDTPSKDSTTRQFLSSP